MKQRIDKIIAREYSSLSRSDIKKLIEDEGIFISGKIITDLSKQIDIDTVIKIDEQKLLKIKEEKGIIIKSDSSIKIDIIYEDDDIAVIEKPAGLAVHPARSYRGKTIVSGLVVIWPNIIAVGDDLARPGIVHRLDKDVSGVMAIAKTNKGFYHLKKQFQDRTVKKKYIAVVYGKPIENEGVIEGAIARSKYNPVKQTISDDGKPAITEYKVVGQFPLQKGIQGVFTVIECHPLTGRMHQIRVHLASIGCPIVGDKKYLPKSLLKTDKSDRIMLFAKSIEIEMLDGKRRMFETKNLSPFQGEN